MQGHWALETTDRLGTLAGPAVLSASDFRPSPEVDYTQLGVENSTLTLFPPHTKLDDVFCVEHQGRF